MDVFLAYWAEDGDDSLDTFETEQEAVDCLEEWIERRRDDAADEGWPLGMRGYVARLTHRVQEFETKAPEGSSFETCCDYAVKSLPDPQAVRLSALEAENAGLRAQLAAPLRLGRGPTHDEVEARGGKPWMFAYKIEPDQFLVTTLAPHPRVKGHYISQRGGLVRLGEIGDAIPLNAARQPCRVGVKV